MLTLVHGYASKEFRDIVSGLVVLALMLTTDTRTVGIALLVEAIVPLGDMSNILGSRGSKPTAFAVHGVDLHDDACRGPLVDSCHMRELVLASEKTGLAATLKTGTVDWLNKQSILNQSLCNERWP